MNEFLKILGKIVSKISVSIALSRKDKEEDKSKGRQNSNQANNQSVNIYLNDCRESKTKKISRIYFISKFDHIFENELIKEIIIKAEFEDGSAAAFIPIEFGIENMYDPVFKVTNEKGLIYIENIRIQNAGNYKIFAKDQSGIIINEVVEVKSNKMKIRFLTHPQDVSSKEVLGEVLVEVAYESGLKIVNEPVKIEVNKENVSLGGTDTKYTNEDGIAIFDNLVLTKTGGYKLKAVCRGEYVYSEPFHVFAPGITIDFGKYESGTSEEVEAFLTALLEKQSQGDSIKYNGEEY